jgi:hypothetical protein
VTIQNKIFKRNNYTDMYEIGAIIFGINSCSNVIVMGVRTVSNSRP